MRQKLIASVMLYPNENPQWYAFGNVITNVLGFYTHLYIVNPFSISSKGSIIKLTFFKIFKSNPFSIIIYSNFSF